jgi:hypothetical protein
MRYTYAFPLMLHASLFSLSCASAQFIYLKLKYKNIYVSKRLRINVLNDIMFVSRNNKNYILTIIFLAFFLPIPPPPCRSPAFFLDPSCPIWCSPPPPPPPQHPQNQQIHLRPATRARIFKLLMSPGINSARLRKRFLGLDSWAH